MTDTTLHFRPMAATEADVIAFGECFARNGSERRVDTLRWQYLDNPAQELLVDLAVTDERIGAIYAVQPGFARIEGTRSLIAQSVDTLVDQDFRGRGLFTKMAAAVYERVQKRKGAFVYGFPNANSAPGFFKKLGWVSLDPVPFLVRPISTAFIASKLPLSRGLRRLPDLRVPIRVPKLRAKQTIAPVAEFDEALEELWMRFASGLTVAIDRDQEYLRWRLAKPGEQYVSLGVFEGAQLVAFCSYKVVDKHGGRIGYVLELLYDPGSHATGAALLAECVHRMASDKADVVFAWNFRHSPNAAAHSRVGFVPLPERLRPIKLHIGVRPMDESLTQVLSDRQNWYISYCDSDTV